MEVSQPTPSFWWERRVLYWLNWVGGKHLHADTEMGFTNLSWYINSNCGPPARSSSYLALEERPPQSVWDPRLGEKTFSHSRHMFSILTSDQQTKTSELACTVKSFLHQGELTIASAMNSAPLPLQVSPASLESYTPLSYTSPRRLPFRLGLDKAPTNQLWIITNCPP